MTPQAASPSLCSVLWRSTIVAAQRRRLRGKLIGGDMRRLATALIVILTCKSAFAADQYLCIADKGAGFAFNKAAKTWDYAQFNVAKSRYILKKSSQGYSWSNFGEEQPESMVKCGNVNEAGFIFCTGLEDIRFNTKNLRFQIAYLMGYYNYPLLGMPEGSDTPSIEIGTCAPL